MAPIIKGEESEALKKRLNTLFAKMDETYPDRIICGLQKDHKKWSETVRELSRALGYSDSISFLNAYGYTVKKAASGRPKNDPMELIEELKKRYPNGSSYTSLTNLQNENPDLQAKIKTAANNAKTLFGMSLADYLKRIGILRARHAQAKVVPDSKKNTCDSERHGMSVNIENKNSGKQTGIRTDTIKKPDKQEVIEADTIRDTFLSNCYQLLKPTDIQKYLIHNTVSGNSAANRMYCMDLMSASFVPKQASVLDFQSFEIRNPSKSTLRFFYQYKEDKTVLNTRSVVTGHSIRDYMGTSIKSRTSEIGRMYSPYEEHLSFPYSYQFTAEEPDIQSPKEFLITAADILQQNKDKKIRIEYCNVVTENKDLEEVHWGYGDLTGMCNGVKLSCSSFEMVDALENIISTLADIPIALFSIASTYTDRPVVEIFIEFENEIDIKTVFSELMQHYPAVRMLGIGLCIDAYHIYLSGSHSTQIEKQRVRYERTWAEDNYQWLKINNNYWGNPDWQNPDIYIKDTGIVGNLFNWADNIVISEDICKSASQIRFFRDNKHCKMLIAPPGIKQISTHAFLNCTGLKSVWLPGVSKVGEGAFSECRNLLTAWIPEVSHIRSRAFAGCDKLEYLYLSQKFKDAQRTAFSDSIKLKVLAPEGSAAMQYFKTKRKVTDEFIIEDGVLVSYVGNGGKVLIPEGIIKIGDLAFANCTTVTEVSLPHSTVEIGLEAFKKCTKLRKINFSDGVKKIGMSAFEKCINLEKVIIPEGVTEIDSQVFFDCKKLSDIHLPKTLTTIKDLAFGECNNLNAVIIPETVEQISDYAFVKDTDDEDNADETEI